MTLTLASAPSRPVTVWETGAIGLILATFLLIGANNIQNHAFAGQDFSLHVASTNRLLAHPGEWFTQDFTNRPLVYWMALDAMALTRDRATFECTAAAFVLLNAGALLLLYDCTRRCIASPAVRIAALLLIATLPVTLLTSVVFAADAMVQPPFALLCWSLVRWAEAPSARAALGFSALAGAALTIGQFAKFTFLGVPCVVLGLGLLLWRGQRLPPRYLVALLGLGVAIPLAVGLWLHQRATRVLERQPAWHAFDWHGTGEMTWRSLGGLRFSDARIFSAPTYWQRAGPNRRIVTPLLDANAYSYPALLHLATFTDVLDFGHGGALYGRVPRPPRQQTLARWSVRSGLIFSLTGVAAVAMLLWRIGRAVIHPERAPATAVIVWLGLATAWQLALVVPLPFVHHAYDWGYWLPRLVLPALWGFALGLFVVLDEWLGSHPRLAAGLLILTAVQAGLQAGSVWF